MTDDAAEIRPDRYHCTFGPHDPIARIEQGREAVVWCVDARGLDENGEAIGVEDLAGPPGARRQISNPVTGPIHVEGAEPGDALAVHLLEVAPTRPWAWSAAHSDFGLFSTEDIYGPTTFAPPQWPDRESCEFRWDLDLERGTGRLELQHSRLREVELPLSPFLGCLGVAPERGECRMTMTPSRHGGNMDCPQVRAGTTVYFPVFEEGGLLLMGDCHAAQGDGELCGVGLEVSCRVRLRVEVLDGWTIRWPRAEDDTHIMTIGSVRPLRAALAAAQVELLDWLVTDYGFDALEAWQVLSQVGTTRIGNVVDPNYSVVARFPKAYLPE
ncbi:MAG: acetamidase/formamidase family protein [Armatimonadota bacterium]|nr:acetamidase/formamidase family protein [Armatimonadota bacterium]